MAILILAIPVGVNLVQRQQQLKIRATGEEIKFSGEGVTCNTAGCTTTEPDITIELTSPFGPRQEIQTQ